MCYVDIALIIMLVLNPWANTALVEGVTNAFTLHEAPVKLSALQRLLSAHNVSSRIECLHRCKRHQGCEDVAMTHEKECWLLGKEGIGLNAAGAPGGAGGDGKEIKELLTPHKLLGLHVPSKF